MSVDTVHVPYLFLYVSVCIYMHMYMYITTYAYVGQANYKLLLKY